MKNHTLMPNAAIAIAMFFVMAIGNVALAQIPNVTVRFANPVYECVNSQYCLDVEFRADTTDVEIFGVNVRFFYDDAFMELDSFGDFQGGYGPSMPDPPQVLGSTPGFGTTFFGLPAPGVADWVNGGVQLIDDSQPDIILDTVNWTKLFQVCFTVEAAVDSSNFCPPVIWDLEQDPANGGYLAGDDGVVVTVVAPPPSMSTNADESVVQFNWMYTGDGTTQPYGVPNPTECLSLVCDPVITCPADTIIGCDQSIDTSNVGSAIATVECLTDITVSYADVVDSTGSTCSQEFVITRTWIAATDCGADTCVQIITVIDTAGPVIACPPDITISCEESTDPSNTGDATALDNCDPAPTVTYLDITVEGDCPQEYYIDRIWTSIDECGNNNFSLCRQRITIVDETPPTIICPADLTLECSDTIPTAMPSATDNCSTTFTSTFTDVLCENPVMGFTGLYDISLWDTIALNGGEVIPMGDMQVMLEGPDGGTPCPNSAAVLFQITIPSTGQLVFDWQYLSSDVDGPFYDPFGYNLNGTFFQLTEDDGPLAQSGTTTIQVTAGDIFAFEQRSVDCILGEGATTVVEFFACVEQMEPVCSQLIIRQHTVADECGNESNCIQTIYITDTTAPLITCPANLTIECTDSTLPDSTGVATATDNCDTAITITYSDISLPSMVCPQEYVISRLWIAIDNCGNADSCTQVITVDDSTPPVITCPASLTIDCTASTSPDSTGVATAIDNCDLSPEITYSDAITPGTCPQELTITRTWVATDTCGNSSTCDQIITVQDTTAPVITCPASLTIECDESTSPDSTGVATATDNCDPTPEITYSDAIAPGTCPQEYTITRTWVSTDSCGNSTTCAQTIVVEDTTPPTITSCPVNITVECDESTDPDSTGVATATDNCDPTPEVTYDDAITPSTVCPQEYTITRTWTATDSCGNATNCIQIITVDDSTPPVITCPANLTIECTESTLPDSTGFATATDNCDLAPVLTYDDNISLSGVCPQEYNIIRSWIVTDACGNSTMCSQLIVVVDNTPPAITCPAAITVECDESTDPDSTGVATATDNCDPTPEITYADSIAPSTVCPQEYTITRTWTATDSCGNATNCIQIITVDDSTPPVITCPASLTIECDESTLPDSTGVATATDNCDPNPEITYSDAIAPGACPQEYTITRTWVSTDSCGNSATCDQIIEVEDTTPPTIIFCPEDVTVECDESTDPDNTGGTATASDNCDTAPIVTFDDAIEPGACPQEYTITRTWTATDACGNATNCIQTIIVDDSTPPVIVCPGDLTLECTDPLPTDIATATDNCSETVTVTYSDIQCDNPVMGFTDIYDFSFWTTILPPEGGSVTTMDSNEVMLVSPDVTLGCDDASVLFQITVPSTGTIVFDWNYTTQDQDGPLFDPFGYNLNGTFFQLTADNGPNTQSGSVSVSVTAGDIFAFEQQSTDCILGEGATTVVEFFACVEQMEETCTSLVIRNHIATDECGNTSSCAQTFYIVDTTPPDLTCPVNLTIECTDSTLPDSTGVATATDNCDTTPEITYSDAIAPGACPQEYTITRTWTATDACDNATNCIQIITVDDSTPPVVTCPADLTIECTDSTLPDSTGVATATDNCDPNPEITYSDAIAPGTCPQEYTITRTWVSTDSCGNSASCDQVIFVEDSTPPSIVCPEDATIECDESTIPGQGEGGLGEASATDNCDPSPVVTYADAIEPGACPQEYTITRTWTATDACGNATNCIQTIIVDDSTPPSIICPEDLTLECTDPLPTDVATATDNCSDAVTVTYSDIECDNPVMGFTDIYDFSFWTTILPIEGGSVTTMDSNSVMLVSPDGNGCDDVSVLFQITVPSNGTLVFDWNFTTQDGPFWDPFGYNLNGTFVQLTNDDGPDTQSGCISVNVTAGDIFAFEQQSVDCIAGAGATTVVEFFACVEQMEETCTQLVIRNHVATDECGNSSSCAQTFYIIDTTPPDLTCPASLTIECTDSTSPDSTGVATATDNCDTTPEITYSDAIAPGACPQEYTITRTWTATDACDNATNCIQVITVDDSQAPVIECPVEIRVECDESTDPSNTGVATATDNCDPTPEITYSDDITPGACPQEYIIFRTWVATDTCGNSSTCEQIVIVEDTTPPTITSCPGDVTIECDESTDPGELGTASATDNCDTAPVITYNDAIEPGACPQEFTVTRTWIATDACGNSSTCEQIIVVDDSTPPTIVCPEDLTLECDDPLPTDLATATDNCSETVTVTYTDIMCDNPIEGFTDVYDFSFWTTILPPEGGSVTTMSNSEVMLVSPDDLTLTCDDAAVQFSITIPSTGQIVFDWQYSTDDVDGPSYDPFGYNLNGTFFQLTDDNGADIQSGTSTVSVVAGDIFAFEQQSSDCVLGAGATTVVEFFACIEQMEATCTQLVIRTHTATDECGNEANCTQTFFFEDTTAPILTCPDDLTINCDESTAPDSTGIASATDNCDTDLEITFADITIEAGLCAESYTITRRWTATDNCGNSATCDQFITVSDTTAPVIICPADVTVECDAFEDIMVNGSFETMDFTGWDTINIGAGSITINDGTFIPPSGDGPYPPCEGGSAAVTFQPGPGIHTLYQDVTIPAGSASATLRWVDRIRNHFTEFVEVSQEFRVEVWNPADNSVLEQLFSTDPGDPLLNECNKRASDLTVYAGQTIRIAFTEEDNFNFFEVHLDAVELLIGSTTAGTGIATATDNCDTNVWVTCLDEIAFSNDCPQEYTITRTWTASDNCGNSSTCVQTIDVQDSTPPVLTCPDDITIDCNDSSDPENTGTASATDNCDDGGEGGLEVEYSDVTIEDGCPEVIERTWSATDACGNVGTCVQLITIDDTEAPAIICPEDVTVECATDVPPILTGGVTVSDNCGFVTVTHEGDIVSDSTCLNRFTISRIYLATDECGNTATCAQSIVVFDDTPPTIACPAPITVSCTIEVPEPDTAAIDATDNCEGPVTVTVGDDVITEQTCDDRYILTRTYIATDACGNTATCTQVITVFDSTPPTITCPANITVSCASQVPPPTPGSVPASDNCAGTVVVTNGGDVITNQTCPNRFTLTRTYIATDACGNTATCTQVITVFDNTPPTITCPPNITVAFGTSTVPPATGNPTGSDNCGGTPTFGFTDMTVAGPCPEEFTINRTWTATDACGNTATCLQVIFVDGNCLVDLALDKVLWAPDEVDGGDNVYFDITITNEGQTTIGAVVITDYIPLGFTLDDTDWTPGNQGSTGQSASITLSIANGGLDANGLNPGEFVTVRITLLADEDISPACYFNNAEISAIFDLQGNNITAQDIDSDGDTDDTNDPDGEDDIDEAVICVQPELEVEGDAYVCPGETVTYCVTNFNDGFTYEWVLNGGGEIISSTDECVTILWQEEPGGPFQLSVNAIACEGCNTFAFLNVYIQGVETLACNDHVQISLNENCEAVILSGMILEGEAEGNNNYFVIVTDEDGNVIPDATLTSEHIGECFTVMVANECNDQTCWGTICVEDKIPPVIECTDVTVSCGTDLEPVYAPPVTGTAVETVDSGLPIGPNGGTITTQQIILDVPSNAVVTDVDITIDLDHTWVGDLTVELISPAGTSVLLANQLCGAVDNWDNVTFDDQAGLSVTAACNPIPPALDGSVIPQGSLATFNGQTAVGPWILQITDQVGGDGGTLNVVSLDVEYYLSVPVAPTASDACGEVTLTYTETESGEACDDLTLTRVWTATDGSGNTATCVQTITITPLTLENVEFPAAYEGVCGESTLPDNTGWPTVDGTPLTDDNELCNIFVGYWDKELVECGGGRKIVRTWTVLDWCTVEFVEAIQVIKLTDNEGPALTCPEDFEVGTDFWYCYANVSVPKPVAVDECSEIASYELTSSSGIIVSFGNNFVINGLELGTHSVTWIVTDECGNSSTCSFNITVVDDVVPVANCDLHTIVSLTNDGPSGVTLVPASVFDDGSYDNCGPVTFRARRMDSCIEFDWTTEGACIDDVPGGIPPVNSRDRGTVHRPCVPFACCDVGNGPVMVELEVTDAAGNVNYCMIEAEVQDKISPLVACPPDIIVSCDFWFNVEEGTFVDGEGNNDGSLDEDPLSDIFGNMYDAFRYDISVRDDIIINDPGNEEYNQPYNWGLDGWADDNCQVNLQVRVRVVDDCSGDDLPGNAPPGAVKMIERRFSAIDGQDGNAPGTCTQRIWVVDFDPFYITDNTCNNPNPQDGVIWPCDVLLTTCPEDLGNTGEPTIFDDACSLIGVTYEDQRFDFVDGACFKILREWAVIDWCQYDPLTGAGLWHYTQVIKVHDEEGPAFAEACEQVTLCVEDEGVSLPDNNQAFLGEDNPLSSSCSVHLALSRVVHETCSDIVEYDVKFFPYNGTEFFYLKTTSTATVDENNDAVLSFNTRDNSIQSIRLNGVPYNNKFCGDYHRILWSVEDGCGNWSHCEYLIRLEDCKQPSPVCINGLSTVVMPIGGEVTIWAKDFDASSFDDCTPSEELLYSFTGDVYNPSLTYNCDNIPAFNVELTTQIWVADGGTDHNCNGIISWDERNKDFCTTTIVITDNNNVCEGTGSILAGEILTEHTDAVGKVAVNLSSPGHFFPQYVTAQDGKFAFNAVPYNDDYTITPERNDEHRNGVSTLDLVRIQKHLLGKELFTSPYQYIAADANNTESISAIDLVEIRKLILGIYTAYPNNKSWRFVEKGFPMNSQHPWPFSEEILLPGLAEDSLMYNDFVGVKIGDVNNSAKANANQVLPRNGRRVLNVAVDAPQVVEAGELVTVNLTFPEVVEGFQWTLEAEGLAFESINSDVMHISDNNVGILRDEVITMSWNAESEDAISGKQTMTMSFIATTSGDVSKMIRMTSKVTEAEAYTLSGEILDVKLSFGTANAEFALYQNEPNPWNEVTSIGFDLPADASATLTVFDPSGKAVLVVEGEYKAGYNTIIIDENDLPANGVMYYRLESGEYSASKKMVLIK